nr:hypothetical protein [Tanacetum cinerariifolium]
MPRLFEAIQARFGGNDPTKKTQRTLLKQMYENFNAPITESLDSIFNRLQKIRNKADLDTMSFDGLYNNFKIVEQEVKRVIVSSPSSGSPNMALLSSPGSTNEVDTTSIQVSAINLEQIHEDDLEEIDLKWQLALLSSFAPPSINLSNSDLEEFQHPEFKGYGPKDSKSVCINTSNKIKKALYALITEDWVSDSDEDEFEEMVLKSDNVQHKPEQANQPKKLS